MHTYLSEKLKSSILTCIKIIVGYLVEGYQTLWQNTKCKILVIEDTQMFTPHFNPHNLRQLAPWVPHTISKHSTTELHSLPSPRFLLKNFMIKLWNESKEEKKLLCLFVFQFYWNLTSRKKWSLGEMKWTMKNRAIALAMYLPEVR